MHWFKFKCYSIWAAIRQNLSSGFPIKQALNQSPQLQRLASKLKVRLYSTAPVVFQRPTQASGEGFLAHRNPTRCSVQVPTAGKIFSRRNSTATPPRVNIFTCMTAVGDKTAGV